VALRCGIFAIVLALFQSSDGDIFPLEAKLRIIEVRHCSGSVTNIYCQAVESIVEPTTPHVAEATPQVNRIMPQVNNMFQSKSVKISGGSFTQNNTFGGDYCLRFRGHIN
jgi:hypothetical protein